jgi:putative inorganic carbon (HCO3(-)) transporter
LKRRQAVEVVVEALAVGAALPPALAPRAELAPLLLAIPLARLAFWRRRGRPLEPSPLNLPLLIIFTMVLVSLWATYDIGQSLGRISGMVVGFGIFALVGREASSSSRHIFCLAAYLLGGLGLSGLALLGTRWLRKFPVLEGITSRLPPRLDAFLGKEGIFHPNIVAGALLWVLPLVLIITLFLLSHASLLRQRVGTKKTAGLLALLLVGAPFMSGVFLLMQSRGAFFGLALSMLVVGLPLAFLSRRNKRASLKPLALSLLIILALVAGVMPRIGLSSAMEIVFGGDQPGEGALSIRTLGGRVELWSRAIYAIQDFPFTGMGMGTFQPVVNTLYPLFTISPEVEFVHPHNHLLSAAVDLGIPGLIAYLSIYLTAGWMLLRIFRQAAAPWIRALALGYGACFLAYFIYGLTDAIALGTKPGILFWYMLGLVAALYGGVYEHGSSQRSAVSGQQKADS